MTKRINESVPNTLALVAATLLVAACETVPETEAPEMDVRAELRIASDATFAPFHFVDESGQPTGFDIELAILLAERAGYVPAISVLPYDELFTGLVDGSHQVVAATTGITPERQQTYLFSAPYYDTCQAALVRTGEGEPLSIADLAGRRVGAAGSGTSVRALDNVPDAIPVLLSQGEATEVVIGEDGSVPVLVRGDIDALLVDEFDAVEAARASNGRLRVMSEPVALEQYALVLAPNNTVLKRALDRALESARDDGTLERLMEKYGLNRDDDWPVVLP